MLLICIPAEKSAQPPAHDAARIPARGFVFLFHLMNVRPVLNFLFHLMILITYLLIWHQVLFLLITAQGPFLIVTQRLFLTHNVVAQCSLPAHCNS